MASQLKVDTLTGVTTAGSILVTGEGNSTTTNLQQGLNKHWCNLQADGFSINDSFNNASCTDFAACNYAYTYTNAFANNDYCPAGFIRDGSDNNFVKVMQGIDGSNFSTTTITVRPAAANASSFETSFDPAHCCLSITGDLA